MPEPISLQSVKSQGWRRGSSHLRRESAGTLSLSLIAVPRGTFPGPKKLCSSRGLCRAVLILSGDAKSRHPELLRRISRRE